MFSALNPFLSKQQATKQKVKLMYGALRSFVTELTSNSFIALVNLQVNRKRGYLCGYILISVNDLPRNPCKYRVNLRKACGYLCGSLFSLKNNIEFNLNFRRFF